MVLERCIDPLLALTERSADVDKRTRTLASFVHVKNWGGRMDRETSGALFLIVFLLLAIVNELVQVIINTGGFHWPF
jgi:hypothetical protein